MIKVEQLYQFMLNCQNKGPVFSRKAECWKFDICGNPVHSWCYSFHTMINNLPDVICNVTI